MKRTTMALLFCVAVVTAGHAQTLPKVFFACYTQNTGTIYRIKEGGLSTQCTNAKHTEFNWIDGVPGYDHGSLNGLADDDHPQYLRADGTRALTGDLNAGGKKITGLAVASANGDAVSFEQAVKRGDVAGGDLAGAFPTPTVAMLQGHAVAGAVPSAGQVLTWNGTAWTPATPVSAGGLSEGEADARYLRLQATAADADKLDGRDGTAYLNASNINSGTLALARLPAGALAAFKSIRNASRVPMGGGVTNVLRLDFTTPAAGFVFASASGDCTVSAGSTFTVTWAYIIGTTATEGWTVGFPVTTIQSPAADTPLMVQRVLPVVAGANSIFLNAENINGTPLRACAAELVAFFTTSQLP